MELIIPKTFEEHLNLFFVSSFLAMLANFFATKYGFYKYPNPLRPLAVTLWHLIGAFLLFLMITIVIIPGIALFRFGSIQEASHLDIVTQGWFNLMSISLSAVTVIAYSLFQDSQIRSSVWGNRAFISMKKSIKDFLFGSMTWLIGYPFMLAVGQLAAILTLFFFQPSEIEQVAVRYLRQLMDYPILFAITAFLIIFLVPIMEEVMFRGFLQTWINKILGKNKALGITSVIFALFHFSPSQGQNNIELILSLFTLSCFLGFIYERQQSLWAPIGLHITFNAISVLALLSNIQ